MKKKIIFGVFIVLIVATIIAIYKYVTFNTHYSTSNAVFVKSDSLTFLSFKLPGKIEKIYVNEGESVKKGELLAKLDTKELEIQKKEVLNNIQALEDKLGSLNIQKDKLSNDIDTNILLLNNEKQKLSKNINAFKYSIDAMKYKLDKLRSDYKKFKNLYSRGKISKDKYENVKVAFFALQDNIKANEEKLQALKLNVKTIDLKIKLANNNKKEVKKLEVLINATQNNIKALKEKSALLDQNIKNSFIYAPFNGKVAKKFSNNFEVVRAGEKILSVVNLKDLYVLDLMEETKLKGITVGCKAKIHIDALNKDFDGVVSEILPASAATFALIPRDISSGEFTKLTQRFYVKVKFNSIPKNVLVGMSGEVIINKCKVKNEK